MLALPKDYDTLLSAFVPVFSRRVWQPVQVLLTGAILAPGKRTVTAVLRVMGLSDDKHFQNYHRVLNRAVWPSGEISRRLLMLLLHAFAMTGPIVMGLHDTVERRRGTKIKARGIYRDPKGKFATQVLPCTDQETEPEQIVEWFARRWQV
jgi:hypothetical protein